MELINRDYDYEREMTEEELKDNLVDARYIDEMGYTMCISFDIDGFEKEIILGVV